MADEQHDDSLAYGDDHGQSSSSGERSLFGSVYHHVKNKVQAKTGTQDSSETAQGGSLFNKLHRSVHQLGSELHAKMSGDDESHSHTHASGRCSDGAHSRSHHRFASFAPQRIGNEVKWYVDGCTYMWAVSRAIEGARQSIWILDWWLSPELYLRRPPAKFEGYRLDRMLLAAAERGVKVNIIVYKEVTQALTRKYLSPSLPDYLHSLLPASTDRVTSYLTRVGIHTLFQSLENLEANDPLIKSPVTVSSSHTKHGLENLHTNIAVFRHPDHLPDRQVIHSDLLASLKGVKISAATAARLPGDTLKALYGAGEDTVLYWAHHEKLCLVDSSVAFMGGLDLCFGRWDTNQHSIADAHPTDLKRIVFPGQDFNNARSMDFQEVSNWGQNKLDRTKSSRMGWSDVALCLRGPSVEDLRAHFVDRWNFIYDEKYRSRIDARYVRLNYVESSWGVVDEGSGDIPEIGTGTEAAVASDENDAGLRDKIKEKFEEEKLQIKMKLKVRQAQDNLSAGEEAPLPASSIRCQLTRSCAKWSHGTSLEHSIADAYMQCIERSQHFVYIENQFFITASGEEASSGAVRNRIGRAIVERIIRAAKEGQRYKVFVMMPAIPAFAGDLRADASLGTRAIMEFQYNSICRGGSSIMERIARAGFDPMEYIRFYNVRNYDRINSSQAMAQVEQQSGVDYGEAQRQHDDIFAHQSAEGGQVDASKYQWYQQTANSQQSIDDNGRWDSVAECYMMNGEDIRNVPWPHGNTKEIEAFVSEELYIHSKLLIADDRVVICGSANLNDRSQLGDHDSEIAIVIEDTQDVASSMNGQPWPVSRFAASLRRQIFRKHLGLIPAQNPESPDANYETVEVANVYDWGSEADQAVADPLSDAFLNLWYERAKSNTDAFEKVFHSVPSDQVLDWKQYEEYYGRFFTPKNKEGTLSSQYQPGHVLASNFAAGEQGAREVREVLSKIKGNLVQMPLLFLKNEDIARETLSFNAFTEIVYT